MHLIAAMLLLGIILLMPGLFRFIVKTLIVLAILAALACVLIIANNTPPSKQISTTRSN